MNKVKPISDFIYGWLASESASQDKIEVKRIYIDINDGNLPDGLIFSQIMYWHGTSRETGKPRLTINRDGFLWLAKQYGDWHSECRINEHTARKSIARLKERGLIITNLWKFNGIPTIHMRVNWEELERRIMSAQMESSSKDDSNRYQGSKKPDLRGRKKMTSDDESLNRDYEQRLQTETTADRSLSTEQQDENDLNPEVDPDLSLRCQGIAEDIVQNGKSAHEIEDSAAPPRQIEVETDPYNATARFEQRFSNSQPSESFLKWWDVFRPNTVQFGKNHPGQMKSVWKVWSDMECDRASEEILEGTDLHFEQARADYERHGDRVPLPGGISYLEKEYWQIALERKVMPKQEKPAPIAPVKKVSQQEIETEDDFWKEVARLAEAG